MLATKGLRSWGFEPACFNFHLVILRRQRVRKSISQFGSTDIFYPDMWAEMAAAIRGIGRHLPQRLRT